MFIRADDSWPKSLNGFWGNVLCRYYLGVNQEGSKILILNTKMAVIHRVGKNDIKMTVNLFERYDLSLIHI